ncbi:YqgE/AlgH family protein [Crocinitomix catalasitica]|uniref:YqgE/AlgH family protein n=1 Tax=Crocinitomix catalasitica TaxID=184607 RepID=UPI000480865E|nr:YqgE/AlgH family protein [Crocinitomix catalasitica]
MIDLNVYNKLEPKKGRLLITEPFEESSYFQRSVVLLCEHNEDGSFGFVLNNYTDLDLSDFENLPQFETKIGLGGPVSAKNLYYIHTLGDKLSESIHITGNIYAGGNFEELKSLISASIIKKSEIRFFLGYSGWVSKQLNGELKQNAWLVADVENTEEIMDTSNSTLWEDSMKRQGGKYKAFAHFPKNPALN